MRLAYSTTGLFLLLSFSSCQKDNSICNPLQEEARWLPDAQVSVQYSQQTQRNVYNIENETYNVFQYVAHLFDCHKSQDEIWSEMLAFEVPPEVDTFF
jgi:hypothetical protein